MWEREEEVGGTLWMCLGTLGGDHLLWMCLGTLTEPALAEPALAEPILGGTVGGSIGQLLIE